MDPFAGTIYTGQIGEKVPYETLKKCDAPPEMEPLEKILGRRIDLVKEELAFYYWIQAALQRVPPMNKKQEEMIRHRLGLY